MESRQDACTTTIVNIQVIVKPNSKREGVEKLPDGTYRVAVHAPPHEGRANAAVMQLLAEYFSVPKSAIEVVRGETGRKKWVRLPE